VRERETKLNKENKKKVKKEEREILKGNNFSTCWRVPHPNLVLLKQIDRLNSFLEHE